jgi:hypothetical protein
MLASNPAAILDQIFGRAGIALTHESTQDDHALIIAPLADALPGCRILQRLNMRPRHHRPPTVGRRT